MYVPIISGMRGLSIADKKIWCVVDFPLGVRKEKARNQKFNSDSPPDFAAAARSRMKMISARGERKVEKRTWKMAKNFLSRCQPERNAWLLPM